MSGTLAYSHFVKIVAPCAIDRRAKIPAANLLDVTERLIHESTGRTLATEVRWARTVPERVRGLIGCRDIPPALVIEPAAQVHTFFMRSPIDVVFCDSAWRVLDVASLEPWRLSRWVRRARRVIELPSGAAEGVRAGDVLRIESYASER